MIIIDNRKSEQRIIVTISEKATGNATGFKLKVHSTFTNKSYSLMLPENTSNFQSRFDEFILPLEAFNWEIGAYAYSIVEMNDEAEGASVETGVLQFIDGNAEYFVADVGEDADDYIIYNG